MNNFRLIFRRDSTILERRLSSGVFYVTEIFPGRIDKDARLLDQLLSDLAGTPKSSKSALEL